MHKNCALLLTCALVFVAGVGAAAGEKERQPVFGETMQSLSGKPVDLDKYKGKVLLVVNTASRCGFTPQYEGLQNLHEKYSGQGLAVLGFPCNQFGKQEPGTADEIAAFCKENYGVTFDMFAKVDVNGQKQAPLYRYLTSDDAWPKDSGPIRWNFEKFLISRDGKVVGRFRTPVKPESDELVGAIESELSKN